MNDRNLFPRRATWLAASVLGLAAAGSLQAQTLDFGSCVRVEDLSARLACYDRAAGRGTPAAAPAAPVSTAPRASVPPAPAPAAVPARAADPVAQFGAEAVTKENDALTAAKVQQRAEVDALPKQIEARVTAVRQRPGGEQVLTLENGQVWQQTERRRDPVFSAGDTVVIKRGLLGSFLLTLQKGSPTTRVKRIS